jgi:hypothetical protein
MACLYNACHRLWRVLEPSISIDVYVTPLQCQEFADGALAANRKDVGQSVRLRRRAVVSNRGSATEIARAAGNQ